MKETTCLIRCLSLIDSLGTPSSHMEWMCSLTSRESNISWEIVRWPWQNWTLWEEKIWITKKPTYQNQTLNMEFINFRHLKSSKESPSHMLRNPPEVNTMLNLNNPMCEAFPRVSFFLERFFRTVSWRSYCLFFVLFLKPKRAKNFSFIFLVAKMMNKH